MMTGLPTPHLLSFIPVKCRANLSWDGNSDFGHDKSLAIKPTANLPKEDRPVLFYCGDGVSDLSAARETDLLFAKYGHGMSRAYLFGPLLCALLTFPPRLDHLL